MVCRNFRFHTPLPKASIQQLMNEEKGEIINEMKKWCKKDSGAEKILGEIWVICDIQ